MLKIFNPPLEVALTDTLESLWSSAFGEGFVTDVPNSLLTERAATSQG